MELRARLHRHGHSPDFAGQMIDRRFDRDGEFTRANEVVRVRSFELADGSHREVLGWKGPTRVNDAGYKSREELESTISGGATAAMILRKLHFEAVHEITRYVEVFSVGDATVRLEWYPDCDTLVEIEGDGPAIEQAIVVTGLARETFSAEPLATFAARFTDRTGRAARLTLNDPTEYPEHWPR